MDETYHYPPELLQLLVGAIPRLCKTKPDVFLFFRGAGVRRSMLSDLEAQFAKDRDSIGKFEIARTVLTRLNEEGDKALRARREVVRRVYQFEDFSMCWADDQLEAQGLVSQVQKVVNVKDAFTRMQQERDDEARKHRETQRQKDEEIRQQGERLAEVRRDFYHLFGISDAHERGRLLEGVLNRLFEASGILVRESFRRASQEGQGTIEQVDGVIELDGNIYLVEMKWLRDPVGKADVSEHLVRVFNRSASRAILISYSGYTAPAIETCRESLSKMVIVLCTIHEFVMILEKESSLEDLLRAKVRGSIIDKQPFTEILT